MAVAFSPYGVETRLIASLRGVAAVGWWSGDVDTMCTSSLHGHRVLRFTPVALMPCSRCWRLSRAGRMSSPPGVETRLIASLRPGKYPKIIRPFGLKHPMFLQKSSYVFPCSIRSILRVRQAMAAARGVVARTGRCNVYATRRLAAVPPGRFARGH